MEIVADATEMELVSRGTYSWNHENAPRGYSRGDLQMYN